MSERIAEVLRVIEPSIKANDADLINDVHTYRAMALRLGLDLKDLSDAVRDRWPDGNLAYIFAKLILDPTSERAA
jgi:hypothetical protein